MIKWPWKTNEAGRNMALPWDEALAIPVLANLLHEEQSKLIQLAERFLQQKQLEPLHGYEQQPHKTTRNPQIYPARFIVDDEWEDDIGLVHNQRMVQSGQSWQQGPIILNWLDIQDSFDASGFNLIIHEVAHKLDTRNGDRASGVPLIPLREVAGWEHDLHAAMENIQDEIDLVGESAASIDAYAATDPAECFAVLSEYFFSAPELFAPRFPALWQRFCQFYQQDPLQRLRQSEDAASTSSHPFH